MKDDSIKNTTNSSQNIDDNENQIKSSFNKLDKTKQDILKEYIKIKLANCLENISLIKKYTESVEKCYEVNGERLLYKENDLENLGDCYIAANSNQYEQEKSFLKNVLLSNQKNNLKHEHWGKTKYNEDCESFDIYEAVEGIGMFLNDDKKADYGEGIGNLCEGNDRDKGKLVSDMGLSLQAKEKGEGCGLTLIRKNDQEKKVVQKPSGSMYKEVCEKKKLDKRFSDGAVEKKQKGNLDMGWKNNF